MIILVLNCGSSSLKFRVYDIDSSKDELLALGSVDRIGLADSNISIESTGKQPFKESSDVLNHEDAIAVILKELLPDPEHGCISHLESIEAIGHRVVHGGENFCSATIITPQVKDAIQACCKFAPLHNPANLNGIWTCQRVLEDIRQVAVFDTAFHSTLEPAAYLYALPYKLYEQEGVRRYGFHGTSHGYVAKRAESMLDEMGAEPPYNIITCHLGNGASVAAVKDGKCIDTSMGFTPLEGLIMGTRCGDLDPAIVLHFLKDFGPVPLDRMLNKESGLKGITGFSDMRDVIAVSKGNTPESSGTPPTEKQQELSRIAMNMYAHRIKKYIGAYTAALDGLSAVVFTAGVGEQSSDIRELVLKSMTVLGIELDTEANQRNDSIITTKDSKVAAFVIPTNEELVIAQETYRLLSGN